MILTLGNINSFCSQVKSFVGGFISGDFVGISQIIIKNTNVSSQKLLL